MRGKQYSVSRCLPVHTWASEQMKWRSVNNGKSGSSVCHTAFNTVKSSETEENDDGILPFMADHNK